MPQSRDAGDGDVPALCTGNANAVGGRTQCGQARSVAYGDQPAGALSDGIAGVAPRRGHSLHQLAISAQPVGGAEDHPLLTVDQRQRCIGLVGAQGGPGIAREGGQRRHSDQLHGVGQTQALGEGDGDAQAGEAAGADAHVEVSKIVQSPATVDEQIAGEGDKSGGVA